MPGVELVNVFVVMWTDDDGDGDTPEVFADAEQALKSTGLKPGDLDRDVHPGTGMRRWVWEYAPEVGDGRSCIILELPVHDYDL